MRYRPFTSAKDFSRDVAMFVNLVGEREYWHLLRTLGKGLNVKGYVTETDDLRFSLELQLLNPELLWRKESGNFVGVPEYIHEATDFIIGLGQTIPFLSSTAKKKVRGQRLALSSTRNARGRKVIQERIRG